MAAAWNGSVRITTERNPPDPDGRPPTGGRRTAFRQVMNLLNLSTPVGMVIAGLGGAGFRRGPHRLILADGYRLPFPVAAAFTVGDVLIAGRLWEDLLAANPRLLQHEARHSWQYVVCLGLPMLPGYGLAMAWSWLRTGDRWSANIFERAAGLAAGGYVEHPLRPWWQRRHAARRPRSTQTSRSRSESSRARSRDTGWSDGPSNSPRNW